jgi:hypothetical protein
MSNPDPDRLALTFMLGAATRAGDYQLVSDVARALLGNPELRAACLARNAANVVRVRALMALRFEPCDAACPGWALMNETTHPEIQRCAACFYGVKGPTDDDVGALPEAQAALAQYQHNDSED